MARFGRRSEGAWWAPGRVNLLGEHTDYNGGLVLPMAIDRGNRFEVTARSDARFRIHSEAYGETVDLSEESSGAGPRGHWSDYFAGVLQQFPGAFDGPGLDVLVVSNLPPGRGLSSSASLTVGFAGVLNAHRETGLEPLDIVHVAQAAENDYVGLDCGVLDPFAVTMGQTGSLVALDCSTLSFEPVPFPAEDHRILVADTGVSRALSGSAYNQRRRECDRALGLVRETAPGRPLADLPESVLAAGGPLAGDDVALRRARHVIGEQRRVREAVAALRKGELAAVGALMIASHHSLAEDFAVSCRELDVLVELLVSVDGVLGAKMTGAGFGGAVVALVAVAALEDVQAFLPDAYASLTGRTATLMTMRPSAGFHRLA